MMRLTYYILYLFIFERPQNLICDNNNWTKKNEGPCYYNYRLNNEEYDK